ncbi:MAG: hypothetical protein ABIE70_00975 [bacterium]
MYLKIMAISTGLTLLSAGCCDECRVAESKPAQLDAALVIGTWDGIVELMKYEGTDSASSGSSAVHFEFTDSSTYHHHGLAGNFPFGGGGDYSIRDSVIELISTTPYQAIFDWRYIPGGVFDARVNNDSLWLDQLEPICNWRWHYAMRRDTTK